MPCRGLRRHGPARNGRNGSPRQRAGRHRRRATRSALSAEGEVGPRGGPPGSLYVAIHVTPHPSLKREGTSCFHQLALSIAQAIAGNKRPGAHGGRRGDPGDEPGTSRDGGSGCAGRGAPPFAGRARAATSTSWSNVKIPTKSRRSSATRSRRSAAARRERAEGTGRPGVLDRLKDRAGVTGAAAAEPADGGADRRRHVAGACGHLRHGSCRAVSEILSRVAPGGVSVEPGYRLTDEGLGRGRRRGRPATVRAYLPGARIPGPSGKRSSAADRGRSAPLGLGLREIGGARHDPWSTTRIGRAPGSATFA